jgi:hypothetical protein
MPEDKENQNIYIKTFEKGKISLPKFMTYEAGTRTYQISTSEKTNAQNYQIDVSLSETFPTENIYSFTVKVMPKQL